MLIKPLHPYAAFVRDFCAKNKDRTFGGSGEKFKAAAREWREKMTQDEKDRYSRAYQSEKRNS